MSRERTTAWPNQAREALGEREVSAVLDGVGGMIGQQAMELLGARTLTWFAKARSASAAMDAGRSRTDDRP